MVKDVRSSADLKKTSSDSDAALSPVVPGTITQYETRSSFPCILVSVIGTTVVVRAASRLPLQASVKVEHSNRMWTGDVWACEAVSGEFIIEIQSTLMLSDVAAVEQLADRFMHRRRDSRENTTGGE